MSAKSDPGRSLALLWGSHTRPGRSGLTVRAIVDAAIELADAEGLDAATMRRVADKIGSGTMSLYTHVPGKTELNDLMVDTVIGELYTGVDDPAGPGGWREGCATSPSATGTSACATPGRSTPPAAARPSARTRSSSTRPSCGCSTASA